MTNLLQPSLVHWLALKQQASDWVGGGVELSWRHASSTGVAFAQHSETCHKVCCSWSWWQIRAPESLQIHEEYELRHSVLLVPLHARCMAGEGDSCHHGFMMPTLALMTPSQGRFH